MTEDYTAPIVYARPEQTLEDHLSKVSAYASRFSGKFNLAELLRIAGLLHDYGKTQPEFQTYLFKENARRGEVPHSIFGALKAYGEVAACPHVAEILANIIIAHHGKLNDYISPIGDAQLRSKMDKEKPLDICFKPIEEKINLDVRKLYEEFLTAFNLMDRDAFGLSMLTKLAYSCLVDADRLDAFLFESGLSYEEQAADWDGMLLNLSNKLERFKNAPETEMSRLRQSVSDGCAEAGKRGKGIYKLEVPTGGGKTLASLRFALEHAKHHGMDRIIYVIPYLSILSQTAEAIREALGADENTVLEHHSGFLPDDKKDSEKNYKLHTDRWDAPIILTTQVQFLESIFSARGSDLRKLHNMANSVLIFDEVQSLPVKCVYLFNGVINFLKQVCGSTVLLCTATQPNLDKVVHPAKLKKENPSLVDCGKTPERTSIENCLKKGGYNYQELAAFVLDKHKSSTLVIVNTKAAAKSLYEELEDAGPVILHLSTNMCSAHRDAVIKELKERLALNKSVICVSTQLIEAGVDISLECVIRDLAGLDSILQAAGRCNRHGEFGETKPVYVVDIEGEALKRLPDIEAGAKITRKLFNEDSKDINEYYRLFFFERESVMSYPVDGGSGNIFSWLTDNLKGLHNYRDSALPPSNRSAIQSAADAFYVIDRGRTDVIVPYGKMPDLLAEYSKYSKEQNFGEMRKVIKELGKYGVSLYKYQTDMLKNAIYEQDGLLVLQNGFYDKDRGIDLNGRHEFLHM